MRSLLVFGLAFCVAPVARAADPAELFPADSIAYLEFHQPSALAKEIQTIVKGSGLEDVLAFVQKLREEANPDNYIDFSDLGILGTLLSPEGVAELQRFQGFAIAVTGFNAKHEPELAAVLQTGESNLPTLLMRAYLSSSPMIRKLGEVESVVIYQEDPHFFEFRQNLNVVPGALGGPKLKREALTSTPTYALLPGLVVVGSSFDAVGDVVRRAKAKAKTPSLATAAAFEELKLVRNKPGLIAFTDFPTLVAKVDAMNKAAGLDIEPFSWELVKNIANPKAVRTIVGAWSLDRGAIDFRLNVRLDPTARSPLFDALAGKVVSVDHLGRAPKDSWFALTATLPADKRWERLFTLADAVAKSSGELGRSPSEAAKELENQTAMKIARSVVDRIEALTIVVPRPGEKTTPWPIVVVHTDADVAEALDNVIPTLFGLFSDSKVEPVTEVIAGQKVRSFPTAEVIGTALHIGRKEGMLFFGADRKQVAAAMIGDAKEGLLAVPRVASALKDRGDSSLVGVFQWGAMLVAALQAAKDDAPAEERDPADKRETPAEVEAKIIKELAAIAPTVPPLIVSFARTDGAFRVEVRQAGIGALTPKLVDWWMNGVRRNFMIDGLPQ